MQSKMSLLLISKRTIVISENNLQLAPNYLEMGKLVFIICFLFGCLFFIFKD